MNADKCAIYIDGAYLSKMTRSMDNLKIDLQKLCDVISKGTDLLRAYYYEGIPYESIPPTKEEEERARNFGQFIHGIKKSSKFEVKLGRTQKLMINKKPEYRQKEVDVMLAVDLVKMSLEGQISKAIVLAGDSDFGYAVQISKNAGVSTRLYYSEAERNYLPLLEVFDERFPITKDMLKNCILK